MVLTAFSAQDPYLLTPFAFSVPYRDVNALTLRSQTTDSSKKTLVILSAGQSNRCNEAPTVYSPTAVVTINIQSGATTGTALTAIDESTAVTNGKTVSKIGTYQTGAKTVTLKIAKKNSPGNYDIVVSQSFAHPGGGWADATLASPYVVPATGSYYLAAWSSGTSDTVAGTVVGAYVLTTDVTGNGQTFTEDPAGGTWALRYTSTNDAKIDVLNPYDGAIYNLGSGALPGCDWYQAGPLGLGHIMPRVADKLITAGTFDRVIIAPLAISGTSVNDWANGILSNRVPVAMGRLAARGITPASTGVTFCIELGLGETDNANSTSSASYQASFATFLANAVAAGFSGRTFQPQETWNAGATSATVRAGQAAVVNGTTVFAGGDLDTLNNTNRQDTTHFNDVGIAAAATLIYNAWHATGAPY